MLTYHHDFPTVYCLWLLPASPEFELLQKQIKQLAKEAPADSPSPTFEPHVTFLSGLSLNAEMETLVSEVRDGLKSWMGDTGINQTLDLKLDAPINGGSFYTAIIYPIQQDSSSDDDIPGPTSYSKLIAGRSALQARLQRFFQPLPPAQVPKPYFPHLSLQYSGLPQDRLGKITREFVQGERDKGELMEAVRMDRCALMRCEGETDEWTTVEIYDLKGEVVDK